MTIPGEVATAERLQAFPKWLEQSMVVPVGWSPKGTKRPRIARATRMPDGNRMYLAR